jgi:hypothetical protein
MRRQTELQQKIDREQVAAPERVCSTPAVRRGGDGPRRAFCKTAAGAGTTIAAYLDMDATGTEVTVNCDIDNGSNLNDAFPLLKDGTPLTVYNIGGTWYCTTLFTANEDCE